MKTFKKYNRWFKIDDDGILYFCYRIDENKIMHWRKVGRAYEDRKHSN